MGRNLVAMGLILPLLLAIVPAQLAVPAVASPNPVPQMAMSLTNSGVVASPSFYAPGEAMVAATLSIDKIPGERLSVIITATVDTGWAASCTPSQFIFDANHKVWGFTAYVTVPQGTPADMVGILRLEATGSGLSLQVRAIGEAVVTVAPYYMLYLQSPNPYKEVPPGSRLSFVLEIRNLGNSIDSYDLGIDNDIELAAMGWTVSFTSPSVIKVPSMGSKTIRLYVLAPQRSVLYKAEGTQILVKATSQNSRDTPVTRDMIFAFFIYERGTYIDWFAASIGAVVLIVILTPTVLVARRINAWRKARRPPPDYEDEYYDDDYEEGNDEEE